MPDNELDPFAEPPERQSEQYGQIPKPVFQLSSRAVRLYGWLSARYGGYKLGAFPKHKTLARELGWCRLTVIRAQQDLQTAGWMQVTERPGTSNMYRLVTSSQEATRLAKMQNRRSVQGGVTPESQGGVTPESHHEPANYVGATQLQPSFYERSKERPPSAAQPAAESAGIATPEGFNPEEIEIEVGTGFDPVSS